MAICVILWAKAFCCAVFFQSSREVLVSSIMHMRKSETEMKVLTRAVNYSCSKS